MNDSVFDCVVLDLRLPDISGFELLERVQNEPALHELPIVVFTGKELAMDEELRLRKMAKSIIIKGVQSPERLLDETALFLHRVTTNLPLEKQKMLERLHNTDEALVGKKVLVVDDDIRNIFALTSLLERHKLRVVSATNGREAVGLLEKERDVSFVLMDIMMRKWMAMKQSGFAKNLQHKLLPIVALTAKDEGRRENAWNRARRTTSRNRSTRSNSCP
jgi:CheY-like chemotaxis protein